MYKIILTIIIFLAIPATSHAMNFNGTTGGVLITNSNQLHASTSDLTISLWFKPSIITVGLMGVIANSNAGATNVPWVVEFNRTAAKISYSQAGAPSSGTVSVTTNTLFQPNKWYHVLVTRKFNSLTSWSTSIYVNGILDVTGTNGRSGTLAGTVGIGRYGAYTAAPYKGDIADVRIYNRALTASEAKASYYGYPSYRGLIASWLLDGNSLPHVPSNSPTILNGVSSAGTLRGSFPPIIKRW